MANTVEQCQALHAIAAFGQHTRSNDVGRGMPSSPLGSTHGRTLSGVVCHHRLWVAQTIERRRAWHVITTLGLHARSDDVRRGMTSPPLDNHTVERHWAWHDITALGLHARSDDVERDMTSTLLDSTHGQMTLGVACHHRLWTAHMVERCRAWHATIAIWQYKQSNDVGGSMPSPPLDYMHGRTTSGVV